VWVLVEGLRDLSVESLQPLVDGADVTGELGDDARCEVLPGEHRRLRTAAAIARAATRA